jgi:uncharacterized protein (DUF433 family)
MVGVLDRITVEPGKMAGKACIRGLRITVSNILNQLAAGADVQEILREYPDLEEEDIRQTLQYAAWLSSERVNPS